MTGGGSVGAGGGAGVFEAATGDGPPLPPAEAEQRSREIRAAVDGLLQIRRLTLRQGGDPRTAPADWERRRPVRAVALALESGGITPSSADSSGARLSTGYRVRAGDRPDTAVVEWLGPPGTGAAQEEAAALGACVPVLARLGWDALLYKGPRGRRFLEVEPMAP